MKTAQIIHLLIGLITASGAIIYTIAPTKSDAVAAIQKSLDRWFDWFLIGAVLFIIIYNILALAFGWGQC